MRELSGRSAVITGASAGIGMRVARVLAAEGMNVALAARSLDKLAALADELSQSGVKAIAVGTDVADHNALRNLVDKTVEQYGTVDVLVNNAGIETYREFHELEIDDIDRTIGTNLTAALVLSRLVLPHMLHSGRGHIVNMSSTAGKFGPAYGAAYGASKAGMIAFTESLRGEYRDRGISASVICPGFTDEGGIYERMKQTIGRGTPPMMGATSAKAVARAVVKSIKKDVPEIIVNRPPMRPLAVLTQICPSLGQWIVRKASHRFLRKVALSRRTDETSKDAGSEPE